MTDSERPHITLVYPKGIPSHPFDDFAESISSENLNLRVHTEEPIMVRASIEDILPTAIFVYLAKPYFEAFLSEMGRDHYSLLKTATKKLFAKLPIISAHTLTSKGVAPGGSEYTATYSILVDITSDTRFKFLFPENASDEERDEILEAIFELLEGNLGPDPIDFSALQSDQRASLLRTIPVRFNKKAQKFEAVNPLPPIQKSD